MTNLLETESERRKHAMRWKLRIGTEFNSASDVAVKLSVPVAISFLILFNIKVGFNLCFGYGHLLTFLCNTV